MPLEWLIDIIKEWVLSLAYATEAWVLSRGYQSAADMPEWTMPLSVTGDLTPDATSTYLKTGIFYGKYYYRRLDGTFLLFWMPAPFYGWWISPYLGYTDNGWHRNDPNILGDYTPWHYSGTATVAKGLKYLKTGFVDRGDPAAYDFTSANFTKDDAWHELDLSGIVPVGAKAVALRSYIMRATVSSLFEIRKHGNANDFNTSVNAVSVGGGKYHQDFTVPVDTDRKVDYRATGGLWLTINLVVKGWWF